MREWWKWRGEDLGGEETNKRLRKGQEEDAGDWRKWGGEEGIANKNKRKVSHLHRRREVEEESGERRKVEEERKKRGITTKRSRSRKGRAMGREP